MISKSLTTLAAAILTLSSSPSPASAQLDEVLITATKRTSKLLDTPLAISVFEASTLQLLGIETTPDLVLRTPSLNLAEAPGSFSIRGIGGQGLAPGSDPGVAVYTDGVYNTAPVDLDATNMFDLQRVEILRGPQATLYGPNAIGGAINLISMPPSMTWNSKVVAEVGNYDYRVLQGLMTGPITDQLSMAVAGSTIERSAFTENASYANDLRERDSQYLRASFKYHWNNQWYSRIQFSTVNGEETDVREAYLLNEVALGSYRIKYLAAYSDQVLNKPVVSDNDHETDLTSHDLQFYSALAGPLNFTSGLYYSRSNRERLLSAIETTSTAAYAQGNWDWTEQLRLTAGLRYSYDNKEISDALNLEAEDNWDSVDWRLGLDYQLVPGQLAYIAVATGSRSGALTKPDSASQANVDPEDLLSVELGYKATLLQQRLQLSSAAYYYDHEDAQALTQQNINSATSWGLELDATALLGEHFTLGGAWSYNSTDELPLTPEDKLHLYGTVHWPVHKANIDFTVSYMYVGEQHSSPSALDQLDAWDRWDSRLSLQWDAWSVAAYVKNIADERHWIVRESHTANQYYGAGSQLTDPRTYGLKLTYQL